MWVNITDDSGYTITSVEVPRGYRPALAAKHAFWAALEERMLKAAGEKPGSLFWAAPEEEDEVEWHTLGDWHCTIDGRTFRHEVTSNAVEVK